MMSESSSCLRRSFSQPSSSLHEAAEGDPIRALTSSISFGRYVSESLAWEKWSAFTHDRYMEEVEKYSRPGSVAEMKAYFEAHFHRKAAERSAAQQNVGAPSTSELNVKTEKQQDAPLYHDLAPKDIYVDSEETEPVEAQKSDIRLSVEVCGHTSSHEGRKSENMKIEEIEQPISAENQDGATLEDSATLDKMKCALPFTKSRPPKHPVSLPNRLNVKASPNCKKTAADSTDKRRETARSLRMSINIENKDGATLEDTATSDKKYALPFTKSRLHKPPAPAKPPVSLPNRPNIKASPNKKKTAAESTDKRRETPRSLHMSINFASREINKPLSPILQKIANSRLVKTLAKASKDRTPKQTPALASVDISKHPTVDPQRGHNWSRESFNHSMCGRGSGKIEGKSQSICISGSKSPSVRESKARSPIPSYSFSFKSEERAAKRKEFFERLEQKAKETEKEQLQLKLKQEKARSNKDKLSSTSKPKQMFSQGKESLTDPSKKVKARSQLAPLLQEKAICDHQDMHSPATSKYNPQLNFSQGTESPSDPVKKVPPMRPSSPLVKRQMTPSKSQVIISRPPWRLAAKTDGCNDTKGKNCLASSSYAKSVLKKTMHENASPNIQF